MAPEQTKPKLRALELGRFIAALLVMLSHAVPFINAHAINAHATGRLVFGGVDFPGPLGVQYFFVLSGFVMASAHHQDFGRLAAIPKFWWRRACRIYPAYWLALCIPVFYLYRAMTPGLTAHMLLLDPWYAQEYIPATWSLRIEMAFYLAFGLCLLPYIGRPLLGCWIFLTFWRWKLGFLLPFYVPGLSPLTHLAGLYADNFFSLFQFYFFAGLTAGLLSARHRFSRRRATVLLVAGTLGLATLLPMEDWGVLYGSGAGFTIIIACALAAAMLGLAGLENLGVFRLGRWAGWCGAMSYPLYIFHEPVMLVINNQLHWGSFGTLQLYLHFAWLSAAILGVAALVTALFDQPLQRALRRVTRRIWPAAALPALYTPTGRPG
jgi:peptidoglycan/LPS O-acetylase OafA/YrhL